MWDVFVFLCKLIQPVAQSYSTSPYLCFSRDPLVRTLVEAVVLRSWLCHGGEFKFHLQALPGQGVNTSRDGDSPGAGASIPSAAPG